MSIEMGQTLRHLPLQPAAARTFGALVASGAFGLLLMIFVSLIKTAASSSTMSAHALLPPASNGVSHASGKGARIAPGWELRPGCGNMDSGYGAQDCDIAASELFKNRRARTIRLIEGAAH